MNDEILIEHRGAISWIVLNRPDAANALTVEMRDDLVAAIRSSSGGNSLVSDA